MRSWLIGWLSIAAAGLACAAPVSFEDTIAQRVQACTGCHGPAGRAASDGYYPRIAGKPAGYLYNQLVNFRDGRRHYPLMTQMVDPLSDVYLLEIATHFASLDMPYPLPQPAAASADVLRRGETLVHEGDKSQGIPACAQCHGGTLLGVAPAIPGLLGLPRDYINSQFGAWKNSRRHAHAPDCMAQIAQTMTSEDVSAVSHWLSSQTVPPNAKPADRLPGPLPIACGGVPAGSTR